MKKITVAIIGTIYHDLMKFAIETTLNNLDDCEDVLVFSDKKIIDYGTYIPIKSEFNYSDYSDFMLKSLCHFVKTEFVLVIQWDGMAVNKSLWKDDYYNYDYIGAPWDNRRFSWIPDDNRVGNGGFSLRSAKLLNSLNSAKIELGTGIYDSAEDSAICLAHNAVLREKYNIKYAPFELANVFSHEWCNFSGNTFGFHGVFNIPLYFDETTTIKYLNGLHNYEWKRDQYDMFKHICKIKRYNIAPNGAYVEE